MVEMNGGASRDRTDDLIVANDALSQLSYSPTREDYTGCATILAASRWETKRSSPVADATSRYNPDIMLL